MPARHRGNGAVIKQHRNTAWWLVFPAVSLLFLVGLVPLIAVINYSFFDIHRTNQTQHNNQFIYGINT